MLSVVIFSKDRAMQCDVLLHSIYKYLNIDSKITILWTASDNKYSAGYSRLIDLHKNNVMFVRESNFYNDVINLLDVGSHIPYTLYFADDYFMIRPFAYDYIFKEFESNEQILGLNLRMGKNIVSNYYLGNDELKIFFHKESTVDRYLIKNNNIEPIEFSDNNTYSWRGKDKSSWGYSMSVVGQVYRTKDLLSISQKLKYVTNPNMFEEALIKNTLSKEFLICPDKHVIIEVCLNLVNDTHTDNPHGQISTKLLNEKWLEEYRIKPECFYKLKGNSKRFINVDLELMK